MSAKVAEYKVGKFQLPRQAHVCLLEVTLAEGEMLGLVKLESGEPLKLWSMPVGTDQHLVSPTCPMGDEFLNDTRIKKLVRAAAEHGDVLHAQIKVTRGPEELQLLHAFATVTTFDPSMIKFSVLRDIGVDTPKDD